MHLPLSLHRVALHDEAPGVADPIETANDLAQLLTWITSNQRAVEMQMEGIEAVPRLMKSLLAKCNTCRNPRARSAQTGCPTASARLAVPTPSGKFRRKPCRSGGYSGGGIFDFFNQNSYLGAFNGGGDGPDVEPSPENQGLHKYRASDVSGFVQWTARTAGLPTETPSMKSQVEQDEHSARHAILGWEGIMEAQFVGAI